MTADTRSAFAALDVARPLVVRLDAERHPDDAAADLIESWSHVETALRALLGGSSLAGQALVSEVRARALLDYPHAHALLGFLAARDRATRADYHPTADDIASARAGVQALEAALGAGIGADTGMHAAVRPGAAPAGAFGPPPVTAGASNTAPSIPPLPPRRLEPVMRDGHAAPELALETGAAAPLYRQRRSNGRNLALGAVLLLALVLGGWYVWARTQQRPRLLDQAIADYAAGRRDDARRGFQTVADQRPQLALPHVYLARLAREDGDLTRAGAELERAIAVDSTSGVARREVGMLMLQTGHPDRAIPYFSRALELDANDRASSGWMACALTRLGQGQTTLATSFYSRAGSGDWDRCRTQGAATPNVTVPATPSPAPR